MVTAACDVMQPLRPKMDVTCVLAESQEYVVSGSVTCMVRQGRGGRQGVLGGVQGAESLFLWRAIGGAVLTLIPATAYSLKVGRALP
jgi:hypothetical protein